MWQDKAATNDDSRNCSIVASLNCKVVLICSIEQGSSTVCHKNFLVNLCGS